VRSVATNIPIWAVVSRLLDVLTGLMRLLGTFKGTDKDAGALREIQRFRVELLQAVGTPDARQRVNEVREGLVMLMNTSKQ
jgi:hypothetical protein